MDDLAYHQHVATLPAPLMEIYDKYWDVTGRPLYELSYQTTMGKLCEISDDWDTFKANCDRFFFNEKLKEEQTLRLAWHCYAKGIIVMSNKILEMGKNP